jgi:hypothetical protein
MLLTGGGGLKDAASAVVDVQKSDHQNTHDQISGGKIVVICKKVDSRLEPDH